MYRYLIIFLLWSGSVWSHEFTPTYPEVKQSHMAGLMRIRMYLFNSRKDIHYYELSVFDEHWKPLGFSPREKILEVQYLEKKEIDISIRAKDAKRIKYICSTSKTPKSERTPSIITSRICSKVKKWSYF